MCTVLLPPDGNPNAVKYIISYQHSIRIKFHENPSSGSRVVPWRQIKRQGERERERDMTKLNVTFPNFAIEPKGG